MTSSRSRIGVAATGFGVEAENADDSRSGSSSFATTSMREPRGSAIGFGKRRVGPALCQEHDRVHRMGFGDFWIARMARAARRNDLYKT